MKLAAHFTKEICMPDEALMIKGELGDRMWWVDAISSNIQ